MRNYIIIGVLAFVLTAFSVVSDSAIYKSFTLVSEKVENIQTVEDIRAVTEEWETLSQKAEIVVDHAELEEISKSLWAMEAEIKFDYDEFMESKKQIKEMILHIRDRNVLGLINVV